jgi:hypothetical protein
MSDKLHTFAVASDEALVKMIKSAQKRLVVIAPALTKPVADAISQRLDDLGTIDVTVILDSDPEVYRLGFGDKEALEIVRSASAKQYFDLREQPGVRIGVVISDEMTMIYSPISRTIEAGSTSKEKPNAIVLTGDAVDRIANASGAGTAENARQREVGSTALNPQKVHAMESNLKANPPKDFDLTRKLKVFSSKVQYVELSISNCRLTTRQVPLPPELIDLEDDDLKNKISSRIQMPSDDIGKIKIKLEEEDKPIEVDDNYLNKERKRIEDTYTYQVNNFGRMILQTDRKGFDEEIERFKKIINLYQEKLKIKVKTNEGAFISNIVKEFTPRWKKKAPEKFERWKIEHITMKILRRNSNFLRKTFIIKSLTSILLTLKFNTKALR